MYQLNQDSTAFHKEQFCESFLPWLTKIVKGEYAGSGAFAKSPKDVQGRWREVLRKVDKAERKRVARIMNDQCPSTTAMQDTFLAEQNRNLMNAFAAGRIEKNEPVMFVDMFVNVYELSLANQIVKTRREPDHDMDFHDERSWVDKMEFFRNYEGARTIQEAIAEYHHRLAPPISIMVVNKIQDDVNVYIGYTMAMNRVIGSLMASPKIYPMQIDLVIIG